MTMIIADVGVCHDGDLSKAVALTRAAAAAGVDAVKFQCFHAATQAQGDPSVLRVLQPLELSRGQLHHLLDLCDELNVEFMCTAFGEIDQRFLEGCSLRRIKIGSGQVKDGRFVSFYDGTTTPVIISNGMCTDSDLENALTVLPEDTTILYCVSLYPTPDDAIDLTQIARLRERFKKPVGFSCHSPSMWPSIAAAALGAAVIEKHITLDRNSPGPDHSSSLEVGELAHWVRQIRAVSE